MKKPPGIFGSQVLILLRKLAEKIVSENPTYPFMRKMGCILWNAPQS